MSKADYAEKRERPAMPSRREALFTARDLLLASLATPAMPVLAAPAESARAEAALIVMHGFAELEGMTLWLQGAKARPVRIEVRAEAANAPAKVLRVNLEARDDCAATVRIDNLDTGTAYRYSIHAQDARGALATGTFRTQTHWQYRSDPPTVRIAAGSCAYLNDGKYDRPGKPYGGGEEIFDAIAATSPDLMLWLGDNIYLRDPEWSSREGINRRYRFYRTHPSLKKLWPATAHVAIWDDHDVGPNDSDSSFVNRGWAREMFHRYWPLPYDPPPGGLYGMITQGDVDIFMLDDRSWRYPIRYPETPDKAMYGAAQMKWLKMALVASYAPFKIIAGGTQFFNQATRWQGGPRYPGETWASFPAEQDDFKRFLAEARIPGVIFLSGDRHFAEMFRIERQGLYPLHEITTSPLTAGLSAKIDREDLDNPDVVPGTLLNERNFAMITVSGKRRERELAIEIRDTKGVKRWEWHTTAAQLAEGTRK